VSAAASRLEEEEDDDEDGDDGEAGGDAIVREREGKRGVLGARAAKAGRRAGREQV
jgi:hypothetical protein